MFQAQAKRRIVAVTCIALIGLGVGLFLALRGAGEHGALEAPELPVAVAPGLREQPARSGPAIAPATPTQAPQVPEAPVESPAQNESLTVLEFKLRTGAPAAGVNVELSHHWDGQPRTAETRTDTMTSDAEGRIVVPIEFAPVFAIQLQSPGWRIAAKARDEDDKWYFPSRGRPTILERIEKLDVIVRYADGAPYEGILTFRSRSRDEYGESPSAERYEVTGGAVQIDAVVGEAFIISVQPRRPGFSGASAESTLEAPLRQQAELVLDYDEVDFCIIEIDLSAFSPEDSILIGLAKTGPNPDRPYTAFVQGGGVHPTTRLDPGEYRVTVLEDVDRLMERRGRYPFKPAAVRTWRSDAVTLRAGETVRVLAEAKLAGAVRARIVDENGQPLSPAGLFIELGTKRPLDWRYLEREYRDGGMWLHFTPYLADEHGVATQPNLAAGKVTLYAEAPGYDYKHVELECVSGQTIDVGTIQLKPATGVIDVEIKNWDSRRGYTLDLYPFGGGGLIRSIEIDGPTYRLERLSLRWYSIAPNIAAPSQNVRLSPDEPYAKVTFINSAPPQAE